MVVKGFISVVKQEATILEEVLFILGDFKELIAYELLDDFPHMQDIQH